MVISVSYAPYERKIMKILIQIIFYFGAMALVSPSAYCIDESPDLLIFSIEEAYSEPALRGEVGNYARDLISRGDEALPFIINALKRGDLSAPTQSTLSYILGKIGHEKIAPDLMELLARKDIAKNARIRISKLLKKWEIRDAIPVMLDLIRDKEEDRNIRIVNIRTLGRWKAQTALVHLSKIARDEKDEPFVRYKAIQMLENFSQEQATDMLINVLERPIKGRSFLVERAIIALGKKKDKRATQVLINLAQKDVGPILKKRCVLSLGEIGDPEAIPLLRKFLKGDNRMLRDYSARVLEKITGKRIEIPEQTTFPAKQKFPQKLLSGPMVKTE